VSNGGDAEECAEELDNHDERVKKETGKVPIPNPWLAK